MNFLKFLASGMLLLSIAPSAANAQYAIGGGNARCSQLIEADAFHQYHANMQWLFGYISGAATLGMAMNNNGPTRLTQALDRMEDHEIIAWVSNWCRSNRTQTLARAGSRLVHQLTTSGG